MEHSEITNHWYKLGLKEGYQYHIAIENNLVPPYTHPPSWNDKAEEFYNKGWKDGKRTAIISVTRL